jgi:O-antigen/teichoic acid export membrane protein
VKDKAGGGALQIIQNVLVNWAAYAVTILIGFFMSPFLVHKLGDPVYGVWTLLGSLTGYLGLLDFGITPSTVKKVAEYRAQDDQDAINRVVTGGVAVFMVIGAVSFLASVGISFFFNDLFPNPLPPKVAAELVLLTGFNLAVTFPASVFIGVLRGFQRYDIDAGVSTLALIARSVLIVVLLRASYGIIALAIATFVFDMLRLGYLLRCVYKINSELRVSRHFFDKAEMRRLFGYSSHFFLIAVGNRINFLTDSVVIGIFLSVAAVTPYSIALRLVTYLRELVIEMTGVLMPAITHLHTTQATEGVRELHIRATKYAALLSLPVAALFFILGDSFIGLWMGQRYVTQDHAQDLLYVLTVGILVHLIGTPTGSVLTGLGRHDIVARFSILQAITNLVVTLILVKRLGLIGVALGTAISMCCFFVWSNYIFFKRYLHQSIIIFVKKALIGALFAQLPFAALLLAIKIWIPPISLGGFFMRAGVAFVFYGVLIFVFCLSADERRTFGRITEKFGLRRLRRA